MTLLIPLGIVISTAIVGNRVLALLAGFLLHVPSLWLLLALLAIDAIQIPFYYWLYGQGAKGLERLPKIFQHLFQKAFATPIGRWLLASGEWGVMILAALPAFGGGIWTATLMAYNLDLPRRSGALWMMAGSALSYLLLWSMGEGVLQAVQRWAL